MRRLHDRHPRSTTNAFFRVLTTFAWIFCGFQAHASMTVLVGEPFGSFGTMMPVGHASIYLDHVCADGPLKLRACLPGEPEGVVIARYHGIGDIDWIATPVFEFLYAVERPDEIPEYASAKKVNALRETYRQHYLSSIVADGHQNDKADDEWWESAGMAYNRRLWGYQVNTTVAEDQAYVEHMNADANVRRYRLRTANCADFAADSVNLYFPGTVRGSGPAVDFGLVSPTQVAESLAVYGEAHPEANLKVIEIAQVPGGLRRSRPVRTATAGILKTKRYLFTLLAIQPEVPLGLAILYLTHPRWKLGAGAKVLPPATFEQDQAAVSAPIAVQDELPATY